MKPNWTAHLPEVRIEVPGWWKEFERGGFEWVSEVILDSDTTREGKNRNLVSQPSNKKTK